MNGDPDWISIDGGMDGWISGRKDNSLGNRTIVNWIGGRIDAKVTTRVRPAEATYMYPLIAKPL